jgi:hypothetical protein
MPYATTLYDRTCNAITLDLIERIRIERTKSRVTVSSPRKLRRLQHG